MFIKELSMYINYFRSMAADVKKPREDRQRKQMLNFRDNLNKGIEYYRRLFSNSGMKKQDPYTVFMNDLESFEKELNSIKI